MYEKYFLEKKEKQMQLNKLHMDKGNVSSADKTKYRHSIPQRISWKTIEKKKFKYPNHISNDCHHSIIVIVDSLPITTPHQGTQVCLHSHIILVTRMTLFYNINYETNTLAMMGYNVIGNKLAVLVNVKTIIVKESTHNPHRR